jgi:hypothetical protein
MTKHSRRDKESVAMCHRETIIVRVKDSALSKAEPETRKQWQHRELSMERCRWQCIEKS